MEILHRLYTESEAEVGSKFPLLPMALDKISGITGRGIEELKNIFGEHGGQRTGNRPGALRMSRRASLYVPPRDKKEQMMAIAGEKGKL